MGWSDLVPALVTGGTTLLGGLFGGDSFTGDTAKPSRSGAMPSTAEGRQLLASLQEQVLGANPVNLSVNGVNLPIMDPFLRQKARSAKEFLKGETDGTPANGGVLGRMAWPIGAAAEALSNVDGSMVGDISGWLNSDGGDTDWSSYGGWSDLIWGGL